MRSKKKKIRKLKKKATEKKKNSKTLTVMGQSKFQHNLAKISKSKLKKIDSDKKDSSVKFNKSNQFFKNFQDQSLSTKKEKKMVSSDVPGFKYKI